MLEEKLLQIGFGRLEANVYLELLKIGPQAVSVIAKRAGLIRTTTYSTLKMLERKGVVSSFKNKSVKFFVANDPNSLVGYLDRRCQTMDYYRSQLLSIIPKLRSLAEDYDFKKPIVRYFEGADGLEHVMYDSLSTIGDFYSVMAPNRWQKSNMRQFLLDSTDFRIEQSRIAKKIIAPNDDESKKFFEQYLERVSVDSKVAFVSADSKLFLNEINIYNHKITILNLKQCEEYGVVIESAEIAASFKALFEFACDDMKKYSHGHENSL